MLYLVITRVEDKTGRQTLIFRHMYKCAILNTIGTFYVTKMCFQFIRIREFEETKHDGLSSVLAEIDGVTVTEDQD